MEPTQAQTSPIPSVQPRVDWRALRQKRLEAQELQAQKEIESQVPVPNSVPWYFITVSIVIGAALLSYGMVKTIKRWGSDLQLSSQRVMKASVFANILAIVSSTIGGGITGYLVWNWALGAMCGFVGSWCFPWIVSTLTSVISRWRSDGSSKDSPESSTRTTKI